MSRYKQEIAGREIWPVMTDYKMSCCDCGLVHNITFKTAVIKRQNKNGSFTATEQKGKKFRVMLKVTRNNRATGQVRRHMRKEE